MRSSDDPQLCIRGRTSMKQIKSFFWNLSCEWNTIPEIVVGVSMFANGELARHANFLDMCYATLHLGLSVAWWVGQLVSRSPFWVAVPKGQCPVRHRGKNHYVCPSVRTFPPAKTFHLITWGIDKMQTFHLTTRKIEKK